MKLLDLEPQFLKFMGDGSSKHVDTLEEADGIIFLCPVCFQKNKGNVGTHSVLCWFVGKVPDETVPKPGRWTPRGTGYGDLSFVDSPGYSRSVLLTNPDGCHWHGFVTDGEVSLS